MELNIKLNIESYLLVVVLNVFGKQIDVSEEQDIYIYRISKIMFRIRKQGSRYNIGENRIK